MKAKDFEKMVYENADKNYGVCPPPTNAQSGLNILIEHFLGEDWYTSMSLPTEHVNTEAIYEILRKYPKRSFKDIINKLASTFKNVLNMKKQPKLSV